MSETPVPYGGALTETSPVDWAKISELQRRSIVALDGLWFMNVLEALGPERTLAVDIKVFIAMFKLATRNWKQVAGIDGKAPADKASIFQALAHLYGHKFELTVEKDRVLMRIRQCAFYENLKRAGRAATHDCRTLCHAIWKPWYAEMDSRKAGDGGVDLQLPVGGDHCDWWVAQPVEV
jgi:hypothetical protein